MLTIDTMQVDKYLLTKSNASAKILKSRQSVR